MIIVDGPDCVGKTTLCKKLLEQLSRLSILKGFPGGYIYSHFTRLPTGFDYYWGYVDRISQRVVQDRFHMSEIVYNKGRRDAPSPLTPYGYSLVDAKLRLAGGFTVLVTADPDLVSERYRTEGREQMYSLETTARVAYLFSKINDPHGPFREYKCDVDYYVKCTAANPWVTDDAIGEILDLYIERLNTLRAVASARPPQV